MLLSHYSRWSRAFFIWK